MEAKQFNANILAGTVPKIPLAPRAEIRENAKTIALSDSKWSGVTEILSEGVYADPTKGNVIEHVAAKTAGRRSILVHGSRWSIGRLRKSRSTLTTVRM